MIMKRIAIMLLIAGVLAGCRTPDQDREPYSRHEAWEDACIIHHGATNAYRVIDVGPGSNMVLEITEGYYRGKRTTAHASRDSVYLILPCEPIPGEHLAFSLEEGTLDYGGSSGYGFNVIDTNMPATAEAVVHKVSKGRILADIKVAMWKRNVRLGGSVGPARLFVVRGLMEFEKKRQGVRTSACTLPSRCRAGK